MYSMYQQFTLYIFLEDLCPQPVVWLGHIIAGIRNSQKNAHASRF